MTEEKCKMCDRLDEGIDILGIHICSKCEQEIVNADIDDVKYQFYKSVFKKMWIDYIISNT